MEIFTSYYGNVKKLRANGIIPVAISVGIPRYFKGDSISYLAPTRDMLKMSDEEYTPMYEKILEKVNLDRLREDLSMISNLHEGKDIALLCYEKPGDFCHRRLFAKWLKDKTGYEVKEYGFEKEPQPSKEIVKQESLF